MLEKHDFLVEFLSTIVSSLSCLSLEWNNLRQTSITVNILPSLSAEIKTGMAGKDSRDQANIRQKLCLV